MNQIPFKPIYENETDAKNEDTLAKFCEAKWNVKMVRQRKLAQFDYMACMGDEIRAFVEMRHRTTKSDQHNDEIITISKLLVVKQMLSISKIPHLFVVQWADGVVGCANLTKFVQEPFGIVRGPITNNRRNTPDDLEPVTYIPKANFQMVKHNDKL